VVVGKTALPPSLIPLPLAVPVLLHPREIVRPQLRPVARMLGAPLLRALQAHLAIQRIGGNFAAMVLVLAAPLAGGITADGLGRLELGRLK
jgi:hypothetical protein